MMGWPAIDRSIDLRKAREATTNTNAKTNTNTNTNTPSFLMYLKRLISRPVSLDSRPTHYTHPSSSLHHQTQTQARPAIEIPLNTDIHWKGHRFLLTSGLVQRSNALESTRRSARAFYGDEDLAVSLKDGEIRVQRNEGGRLLEDGPIMRWPTGHLDAMFAATRYETEACTVLSQFRAAERAGDTRTRRRDEHEISIVHSLSHPLPQTTSEFPASL